MNKIALENQLNKLIKCNCVQTLPYILRETSELLGQKNVIYSSDKNAANEESRKEFIEEINRLISSKEIK